MITDRGSRIIARQLPLPLVDAVETRAARMARILAGVPLVKRASDPTAFTFTDEAHADAERRAQQPACGTSPQAQPARGSET